MKKPQNINSDTTRVFVCFFGITRSLNYTLPSIKRYIFEELSFIADLSVHCHFFDLPYVNNPRTNESSPLDNKVANQLFPKDLQFEEPIDFELDRNYKEISGYGDVIGDNFKSLKNLLHQLHSIKTVATGLDINSGDIVVFVRPDLVYHDSFKDTVLAALSERESTVFLPGWQSWQGLNDRFAVCVGIAAVKSYADRGQYALEFCKRFNKPLNSEGLLDYALTRDNIKVKHIGIRASRMRANGVMTYESFEHQYGYKSINYFIWKFLKMCRNSKISAALRKLKNRIK